MQQKISTINEKKIASTKRGTKFFGLTEGDCKIMFVFALREREREKNLQVGEAEAETDE